MIPLPIVNNVSDILQVQIPFTSVSPSLKEPQASVLFSYTQDVRLPLSLRLYHFVAPSLL